MYKTTVKVDGMACGMCEAHVNDAVRSAFDVKSVSSSRSKCRTEIISNDPLDADKLVSVITNSGYPASDVHTEPYQKKRFSLFGKK